MYAVLTQRNMRVHVVLGGLVLFLASVFDVSREEIVLLLLTIGLVMISELFNTAVEEVVNLVTKEYHPLARRAKNVAAGAVLVSAVIAALVGYLVFFPRFTVLSFRQTFIPTHLTIMALSFVLLVVIGVKAFFRQEQFLKGGMPSGHTAIAFSLATAIYCMTSPFLGLLAYGMALLVAQSRVEGEIHTFFEVMVGALIGMLITLWFFQL